MASKNSDDKEIRCSFCGKSESMVQRLIEGPGVLICDECISLCNDLIAQSTPIRPASRENNIVIPKPMEIKQKLDEYVIAVSYTHLTLPTIPWV